MDSRKRLCWLTRVALPGLGLGLVSLGAYLASLPPPRYHHLALLAYALITAGFLALVAGAFWSVCHGVRSKRFQRRRGGGRSHGNARHHIFTVDRPSCYPPSYEESQLSHALPADAAVVMVNEQDPRITLAPPLYTRRGSETPDERFSGELPPPYSEPRPHGPRPQEGAEQAGPGH